MRTNYDRARGVTLLELLVVLMILSLVLTAAVKTWDVTLERGRAESTARKLDQIVKVIVGDPDYIVAGQRADFGFVGDEGRLPANLQELVVRPANDSTWRGPYLRSSFNESPNAFRIDGWGDTIVYGYERYSSKDSLFVRSYGGRGFADLTRWQTVYFPNTFDALTDNPVDGEIVDVRGKLATSVKDPIKRGWICDNLTVMLYVPRDGRVVPETLAAPTSTFAVGAIPQGTHRLVARYLNVRTIPNVATTTTQNVPVYPGIGAHNITMRLPLDWAVLAESLH